VAENKRCRQSTKGIGRSATHLKRYEMKKLSLGHKTLSKIRRQKIADKKKSDIPKNSNTVTSLSQLNGIGLSVIQTKKGDDWKPQNSPKEKRKK